MPAPAADLSLARLHATLENLAGEVRAAIARSAGQATGEAAREALRVILDGPPGRPRRQATGEAAREALRVILDGPPGRPGYPEQPEDRDGGWGMSRRPTWPAPHGCEPYSRDRYERDPDDEFEEQRRHRYEEADPESPADHPVVERRPGRWPRAVAAGRQAAAW
jgi:hypothetical protein